MLQRAMQRIADYEEMEGLKAYLTMGPVGEGKDLAVNFATDFLEYLEQAGAEEVAAKVREELERNEYLDWDALEGIPDALFAGFRQNLPQGLLEDPDTPTYLHLSYLKDVDDDWLIHGTNHAADIESGGFTRGVWDYATLGLTTWFKDEAKTGGFNFAFYAEAFDEDAVLAYGKEAVIFQASGIETYHWADNQQQIIFWGSSAHDIHSIYRSSYGGFYTSLGEDEFTGSMQECVSWLLERI